MENFNDISVKAETLSVLKSPTDSITCYVELNEHSCNLTLRFDNEIARIAGYPHSWKIFDETIDGSDSTYENAENDASIESFVDEIEEIDMYVSRKTEKEILEQLKKSLKVQFEDEIFKDDLSAEQKEEVFLKMNKAIEKLQ